MLLQQSAATQQRPTRRRSVSKFTVFTTLPDRHRHSPASLLRNRMSRCQTGVCLPGLSSQTEGDLNTTTNKRRVAEGCMEACYGLWFCSQQHKFSIGVPLGRPLFFYAILEKNRRYFVVGWVSCECRCVASRRRSACLLAGFRLYLGNSLIGSVS